MSIFDVEHQPRAHRILQRALTSDRMPHAYIFAGPEGVGRELMAIKLARVILCGQPVQRKTKDARIGLDEGRDACGECGDCRMVEAGTHPDLFSIYRQLNRQHPDATIRKQKALFLGVDIIRHFLVDRGMMKPSQGRAKVFIVREAERLNDSSQNALLKTLEEPPPATFLFLISSGLDRLLPTTRSRCQQVQFQALPREFIESRLLAEGAIERAEASYAAHASDGSLGQAMRLVQDGVYAMKRAWGDRLAELLDPGSRVAPIELAKPFIEDGRTLGACVAQRDPDVSDTDAARVGLRTLLGVLSSFYREAMHIGLGSTLPKVHDDQPNVVDLLQRIHSDSGLLVALRELSSAETSLNRNANLDLTFEKLFIRLARAGRLVHAA